MLFALLQVCELWVLSAFRSCFNCCPPKPPQENIHCPLPSAAGKWEFPWLIVLAGRTGLSLAVSDILLACTGFFISVYCTANTGNNFCPRACASLRLIVWSYTLEHTAKSLLNWQKTSPGCCWCCFCPWVLTPIWNAGCQLRYLVSLQRRVPKLLFVLLRWHWQSHLHSRADFCPTVASEVRYCETALEAIQTSSTGRAGEARILCSPLQAEENLSSALAAEGPFPP